MDLTYAICISIFISSDYVVSFGIEYNTGQFESGELDEEESQLETKSGEGSQISALDGTASEGDASAFEGDTNTQANDESQAELTEEYTDDAVSGNVTESGKKFVIYQWWNGIVPYYVDAHSYDVVIYLRIRKALDVIQRASCLVFKPIPKPRSGHSFVHFTNPNKERECVHKRSAGRRGEPVVVLGYDCMQERDIIHSVMHLLGFRDEVTHPHRDSYIRIMWNNIQPKYRSLFTMDTKTLWTHKLAEYDTLSVMHFHDRAFSINGGPTILPLLPDRIINPSDELSLLDKMKLRIAFEKECNRRHVHFLVETCKNYARDNKKTKDDVAEDLCAFDKFKVTTVKYINQTISPLQTTVGHSATPMGAIQLQYIENGKSKKERLAGVIGVQIGQINSGGKSINNINGINGYNVINNNRDFDMIGVHIDEIHNIGNEININGFNDDMIGSQKGGVHNIIYGDKRTTTTTRETTATKRRTKYTTRRTTTTKRRTKHTVRRKTTTTWWSTTTIDSNSDTDSDSDSHHKNHRPTQESEWQHWPF